jgi:hypothetical protein
VNEYVHTLRDAGAVVGAGTHHTHHMSPLVSTPFGVVGLKSQIQDLSRQYACAFVAQQQPAKARTGFFDRRGQALSGFASREARIRCFAGDGAEPTRSQPPDLSRARARCPIS